VDQVHRARDVGIDDPPRLSKILVQECMAETAPRVRQECFYGTALCSRIKLVDAFDRRKIGLEGFDLGTAASKESRYLLDLRFVGCDQKVVALFYAALRQFQPNAGRCTCDNRNGRVAELGGSFASIWAGNPGFPLSFL
jgi:hypothetical protein